MADGLRTKRFVFCCDAVARYAKRQHPAESSRPGDMHVGRAMSAL